MAGYLSLVVNVVAVVVSLIAVGVALWLYRLRRRDDEIKTLNLRRKESFSEVIAKTNCLIYPEGRSTAQIDEAYGVLRAAMIKFEDDKVASAIARFFDTFDPIDLGQAVLVMANVVEGSETTGVFPRTWRYDEGEDLTQAQSRLSAAVFLQLLNDVGNTSANRNHEQVPKSATDLTTVDPETRRIFSKPIALQGRKIDIQNRISELKCYQRNKEWDTSATSSIEAEIKLLERELVSRNRREMQVEVGTSDLK